MNKMVFELQPDIIVNNRNKRLPGDFSTPEQHITAEQGGRAWESCMTMNDSWGYQAADDDWKTSKRIVRNLVSCARDGGNYLLNIGPRGDGSIPEESVKVLTEVGRWMDKNGQTGILRRAEPCRVHSSVSGELRGYASGQHALHARALLARAKPWRLAACGSKVLSASAAGRRQTSRVPAGDASACALPACPRPRRIEPATVLATIESATPSRRRIWMPSPGTPTAVWPASGTRLTLSS